MYRAVNVAGHEINHENHLTVPLQKIETFEGVWDFFGPLNGTSESEGDFGAKKVNLL